MKLKNFIFVGAFLFIFALVAVSFVPKAEADSSQICLDYDFGIEPEIPSYVAVITPLEPELIRFEDDRCHNGSQIQVGEWYCDGPNARYTVKDCTKIDPNYECKIDASTGFAYCG